MRYVLPLFLALAACGDVTEDDHTDDHDHENEVITTVELTLTPASGEPMVIRWADPEDDGAPVIDPITLSDAVDYTLAVAFLNELEDPAEDITAEVEDESDEHQIFITGSGVEGPATGDNAGAVVAHTYLDTDANGLPVGLENSLVTLMPGSGELVLTLRHMPAEDGAAVKVDGAAELVGADGFGAIGGDNDVEVTFPLTVE